MAINRAAQEWPEGTVAVVISQELQDYRDAVDLCFGINKTLAPWTDGKDTMLGVISYLTGRCIEVFD